MEDLSTSTCWALLRSVAVGRLAVHGDDDEIEIFPVNFIVDQGSVVFRTAEGTKLARSRDRRRAAFEVDDFDFYDGTAWSVVLRGLPSAIEHHDDVVATFDLQLRPWQAGPKPTYVRITPDVVTGRRFQVDRVDVGRRG